MRRAEILAALVLAGCFDAGGIELHLDLPTESSLDPFARPVSELSLTAWSAGEQIYSSTRQHRGAGEALDFGRIPIAEEVRFELSATTASGRVVAYGRSDAPVEVAAGAVVKVSIRLRRPFVYLAGGDALVAIDATLEPGQPYAGTIDAGGSTSAARMLPGGAELAVVTEDALVLVSTATHARVGQRSVALPGPADDLAISADGARAVIAHRTEPPGVSIIDLAALRSGEPVEAIFVATAAPGPVAIAGDTAWILQDRLDNLFCQGESSVLAIPLADPASAPPPIALGGPAAGVTAEPDSGAALLAMPCQHQVVRIAGPGAAPVEVLSLTGATATTVARDRIWATGHVEGAGAHLLLTSIPLGGGAADELALPGLEERAVATALDEDYQGVVLRMTARLSSASEISVLPDGKHVAVLVTAVYATAPAGDAGGGQPIVPEVLMVTREYQLLQLDTGLAAQRLRLACAIEWEPGALLDDFACGRAPGQDVASVELIPTDLSAIYGSR